MEIKNNKFKKNQHNYFFIWFSFVIVIVLQSIPLPFKLNFLRPSLINLLLIYWLISIPRKVSIGTSFFLGIFTDIILGYILGTHSLSFSIINLLVKGKYNFFSNIVICYQSIVVMFFSLINQIIIFFIYFFIEQSSFHFESFWIVLIDGMFWPWFFYFMKKI